MKKFIITVSVLLCLFLAFQWFDYRYGIELAKPQSGRLRL